MNSISTKAIILRRTNYGEADRILLILTPEGQRSVIARGVRREKSKLAGGIELFAVSDVTLHTGKGDLDIVTSARLVRFFKHILEDYDRLQYGYEAINVIVKASRDIDEPEWFTLLEEVFDGLNDRAIPLMLIQTWFLLRYADGLGEAINLERDVSGQPLEEGKTYMYDTEEKGLRLSDQGDITADHIKFLRLVAAKPLRVVTQVGGTEEILPACWLVVRQHGGV